MVQRSGYKAFNFFSWRPGLEKEQRGEFLNLKCNIAQLYELLKNHSCSLIFPNYQAANFMKSLLFYNFFTSSNTYFFYFQMHCLKSKDSLLDSL